MTDLHSHILPGIDDGAQTVEDSLALIRRQLEQGVDEIALTPHFNAERTSVEEFTQRRAESFAILQDAVSREGLPVKLKLGAEVFFSSDLLELDLDPLLLQDTPYLLVEFSPMFYPTWAKDIFYNLGLQGITPLLAHVERYPYMLSDPTRLFDLVNAGAVTQVNANSIMRAGSRQAMVQKFLRWQLVHVLSTDTHSVDSARLSSARPCRRLKAGRAPTRCAICARTARMCLPGWNPSSGMPPNRRNCSAGGSEFHLI